MDHCQERECRSSAIAKTFHNGMIITKGILTASWSRDIATKDQVWHIAERTAIQPHSGLFIRGGDSISSTLLKSPSGAIQAPLTAPIRVVGLFPMTFRPADQTAQSTSVQCNMSGTRSSQMNYD